MVSDSSASRSWFRLLVPGVSLGLVIGLLIVSLQISFAAMIFSGDMSNLAARGAGLTLFGGICLALATALLSSFKTMINICQDAPAAILILPAAAAMGAASPEAVFPTAAAVLGGASLCTALAFFLVGKFKLANLVRYMPFPVVAGFLAGSGWLLFRGGIGVMTGLDLGLANVGQLFGSSALGLWLPGLAFAVLLMAVLERWGHFLVLPLGILAGVGIFYLVLLFAGLDVEQARQAGLLFGDLSGGALWPPVSPGEVALVDWGIVASQIPSILTVALLCLIGLLLNVTGIDLAVNKDIDMDRELLVNSLGNVLAGLGGSSPGYSSLSLSMIGFKTGVETRVMGVTIALVTLAALFMGGALLKVMPIPVLGALLVLLGLFFLKDWLWNVRRKLTRADYVLILIILGCIAGIGFLEGVGLGLLLTVITFVFRFSRVPVITGIKDGTGVHSRKARSIAERRMLRLATGNLSLYEFSGYVFFGSANTAAEKIMARVKEAEPPPGYIVLDFSRVDGVDISAINIFIRCAQKLVAANIRLVIIEPRDGIFDVYQKDEKPEILERMHFFKDRDLALEMCESYMLEYIDTKIGKGEAGGRDGLFTEVADEYMDHLARMESFEALAESLGPVAVLQRAKAGEVLVRQDGDAPGVFVVQWGEISQYSENSGHDRKRVRGLGSGGVIGFWALQGKPTAPGTFEAEQDTTLFFISWDSLKALELHDPAKGLELYKQLLSLAGYGDRRRG